MESIRSVMEWAAFVLDTLAVVIIVVLPKQIIRTIAGWLA